MADKLPSNPNLEQLRRRAKTLLKQHRQGDASCCDTFRYHERLATRTDEQLLTSKVTLADVHHALARRYGFSNWREVREYIAKPASRMAGRQLDGLEQPPLNTTMMGVLKSTSDYYGLELDDSMVYGLSGHAFLINIHTQLCPSGPYCWKRDNAKPLIENMGIRMTDLGFYNGGLAQDRQNVESELRAALDKGVPCSLINMDNQLITGYDKDGLDLALPWPGCIDSTPPRLSFGNWKEFGGGVHVNFYTLEKTDPADRKTAILASLGYAIDMWKNPEKHSSENYSVGPLAYDNWITAVPEQGSGHGNWWNAMVWSECRNMASDYFHLIGAQNEDVSELCLQLKDEYKEIAGNLQSASNKDMPAEEKVTLLKETKDLEASAIEKVQQVADILNRSRNLGSE